MKKIAITLMALSSLSLSAFAQTEATTITAPTASQNTTTTTLQEQKPANATKWSAAFVNETNLNVQENAKETGDAKYVSVNILSLGYNVTPKDKISVAGQFEVNSVPVASQRAASIAEETLSQSGAKVQGYSPIDPYVLWGHTFEGSLLGSDPVTLASRYYIPTTQLFKALGYDNGAVRFDSEVQWTINKLFAVSVYLNPRLYFGSQVNTVTSLREYVILYLNPTDKFQLYFSNGLLTKLESSRRVNEKASSEVGANLTVNKNLAFTFYVTSLVPVSEGNPQELFTEANADYGLVTSVTF